MPSVMTFVWALAENGIRLTHGRFLRPIGTPAIPWGIYIIRLSRQQEHISHFVSGLVATVFFVLRAVEPGPEICCAR